MGDCCYIFNCMTTIYLGGILLLFSDYWRVPPQNLMVIRGTARCDAEIMLTSFFPRSQIERTKAGKANQHWFSTKLISSFCWSSDESFCEQRRRFCHFTWLTGSSYPTWRIKMIYRLRFWLLASSCAYSILSIIYSSERHVNVSRRVLFLRQILTTEFVTRHRCCLYCFTYDTHNLLTCMILVLSLRTQQKDDNDIIHNGRSIFDLLCITRGFGAPIDTSEVDKTRNDVWGHRLVGIRQCLKWRWRCTGTVEDAQV